jgi:transcriptional regulator EpsA
MVAEETWLRDEDLKNLAYILETSLRVHRRSHFFSWAQGPLQTLLPHEILICALRHVPDGNMYTERFSATRYFREEHFQAMCKPVDGLLAHMVGRWSASGQPCMLPVGEVLSGTTRCESHWSNQLQSLELTNVAGHGVRAADGGVKAFFSFSRVAAPLDLQIAHLLHILVPCIFATFSRMLAEERHIGTALCNPAISMPKPLRPREIEILEWIREGKSNNEIAQILSLSPHTVKNHIQNIIKKLGVSTRGQAVTLAISLGVVTHSRR